MSDSRKRIFALNIDTLTKKVLLLSKITKKLATKRGAVILKTKNVFQRNSCFLVLAILVSSLLISSRGTNYDGQSQTVLQPVKNYIEETAASSLILKRAFSAEINTAAPFVGLEFQSLSVNPTNTVQQTALLAFNSLENDFSGFENSNQNGRISIYTVQEGDTLSFIASDFGVSINTIIWANNIQNINSIKPGNELKIPPVSGVIHKVKKGETVASVAKKYAASEEKIVEFNGLPKDGSLQIDDELIVPDGKMTSQNIANYSNSVVKRFAYLPSLGDYYMTPSTGRNWGTIHGRNGVDIANSCGTPIYAAADGSAAIADGVGWNGGFGKFIKLVHPNGTETIYAHSSKLLINKGENVQKGQLIALIGTTGRSTGCHLHFEVHGAKNPLAKY